MEICSLQWNVNAGTDEISCATHAYLFDVTWISQVDCEVRLSRPNRFGEKESCEEFDFVRTLRDGFS